MNKTIWMAFAFGAALGIAVAWKYSMRYDATKDEPATSDDIPETDEETTPEEDSEQEISDMHHVITSEGYVPTVRNDPYVIFPEEFGLLPEYETIGLIYYEDGVLVDDDNHQIDDVENTVGRSSLNRFGEYEEDTVYVRNERRKVDYEICRDVRTYEEVLETLPFDDH